MTDKSSLGEKELKALAYFVVGVSSEGNLGGRDVSSQLSFAGKYRDGNMYPVENSGFSIDRLDADTVRSLQSHLNMSGVTDMHQQTSAVSGVCDLSTRTAVAHIQAGQGMPVARVLVRGLPDA